MSDRGSGTLLGILAALLILSGGVVAGALAALAVAHQHASVAADLGALAAARKGCSDAERVIQLNGAQVVTCSRHGSDSVVEVEVSAPDILARLGVPPLRVGASARAGPAE